MLPDTLQSITGPAENLYAIGAALAGNAIARLIDKEPLRTVAEDLARRIFSYLVFIVLASWVDHAGLALLLGWTGSTLQLVVVALVVREVGAILKKIQEKWHIEVPILLGRRLSQAEQGDARPAPGYIDPNQLNEKIANLKDNIEKLKELKRLEKEAAGLGATPPTPGNYSPSTRPTI